MYRVRVTIFVGLNGKNMREIDTARRRVAVEGRIDFRWIP